MAEKASEIKDTSKKKRKDAAPKEHPAHGNLKLIGIAGLVKGEQYSLELGQSVVIGRSRECDICLRDVPKAKALDAKGEKVEQHFRTVSRQHLKVTYISNHKVELEDLSANGTFLDGNRIEGTAEITDITEQPHEVKLGTTETLCLDWWRLVPKSSVPMVKVKVKKSKTEGDEEDENNDDKKGDKDTNKKKDRG